MKIVSFELVFFFRKKAVEIKLLRYAFLNAHAQTNRVEDLFYL